MFYKDEQQIINIIKYGPIIFIITLGLIITAFLFNEKRVHFQEEKKEITAQYLQDNKTIIKNQIEQLYSFIQNQKATSDENLKKSVKDAVNIAHTIAKAVYEENKHRGKEYIKKEIKIALNNIRFNEGRGYFFIYDKEGVNMMHPLLKRIEGKNLRFFNNKNGQTPVNESLKLLKNQKESFQTWFWQKNKSDEKLYKKIGFVKNFYEMDWFIGTGEYVDEYSKTLEENILNYIQKIKYNKSGYIYVTRFDGKILINHTKDQIGINIKSGLIVDNPEKVLKEISKKTKNGGGYVSYFHKKKPNDLENRAVEKISYVKSINEWKWIIGTGFYQEDLKDTIIKKRKELDEKFVKDSTNIIIISFALIIALLIISIIISKIIDKKFENYRKSINQQMNDNSAQKEKLIKAQTIAHLGTWELELKTMKAIWSREILNIFGLDKHPENAGPEYLKTIILQEDWKCFFDSMTGAIDSNSENRCIYRIKRVNDSTIRWVDCRAQRVMNGTKIIGTIQDITERKKIELALHEQSERLNAIFDASPIGIAIVSKEKKFIETNSAYEELLGYTKDELKYKTTRDFAFNKEEDEKTQENLKKLRAGEIENFQMEKRYKRKDGTILWGQLTIAPIVNKNKKEQYILGMLQDITNIKEATQTIKQNEQMLHHQSKMAAMGEMLENIAHQWRQPLSVITTGSTSIKVQKEVGTLDDEFLIKTVDTITNSAQHLSQTIDDFRDFFKPDKEKIEFNIKDVYDKTISLLSSKFKNRDIEIVENIEDIKILSYDNELIQVLINILNNSNDVLTSRDIETKYIFVDIYKNNDKAIIKIKDNGGGIEEEIMNKIFDPYFTTKHQAQGTGIGLYMSDEIITKHMKGIIKVKSLEYIYKNKKYKGAEFSIELPLNSNH